MSNAALYTKLKIELASYMKMLEQASDTIIAEEVSKYPIFIAHKNEVDRIGITLADKDKVKGNWSINASTLEQFVEKNLISEEKIDSFKTIYKSPKKYLCIFSLSELGADFIFLPRTQTTS